MTENKAGHTCPILQLEIDSKQFSWKDQFISGIQLKQLIGKPDSSICMAIADPWDDEEIADDTVVDLARPCIERFYTGKKRTKLVEITVNHKAYEISKGKHSVSEIKKLAHQPEAYELDQIIDGKITPLADTAIVDVKGCEIFVCHVRDGASS